LRFELEQYQFNLRPVKLYDERSARSRQVPEDIDFVVVRENNEDFTPAPAVLFSKHAHEIAVQESITPGAGSSAVSVSLSSSRASGTRRKS